MSLNSKYRMISVNCSKIEENTIEDFFGLSDNAQKNSEVINVFKLDFLHRLNSTFRAHTSYSTKHEPIESKSTCNKLLTGHVPYSSSTTIDLNFSKSGTQSVKQAFAIPHRPFNPAIISWVFQSVSFVLFTQCSGSISSVVFGN